MVDAVFPPDQIKGTSVTMHLEVENCDAAVKRAADAGATVTMAPWDSFWGARYARIIDPFGHSWSFAHPLPAKGVTYRVIARSVSDEAIQRPSFRGSRDSGFTLRMPRNDERISFPVIAGQRVGAKRRPMTGSAKQSILTQDKCGLLRRSRSSQ